MNKQIIDEVYYYVSVDGATQESVADAFGISLGGLKKHFKKFRDYVKENPDCEYADLYKKMNDKSAQNEAEGRKLGSLSPGSGGKPSLSDEKIKEISVEMKKKGYTLRRASEEFGIPKTTLHDSLRRYNKKKLENKSTVPNISKPRLIGLIALHFRVSLENMCKLFNKPVTEENKQAMYNFIIGAFKNDTFLILAYKYLFYNETINEPKEISDLAYSNAHKFLAMYTTIARHKNVKESDKKSYLYDKIAELTELDRKFDQFRKQNDRKFTNEEILIISRYRVKYALPRSYIADIVGRDDSSLERREVKITDESLKYKLDLLNQYHLYSSMNYVFKGDLKVRGNSFDGNITRLSSEVIVNIAKVIIEKGYNLEGACLHFELSKADLKYNLSRLQLINKQLHKEVMKTFFNDQLSASDEKKR